ncbi:DNA polymerase III subunit gamma/tau [Holosporaceae bacterium 'Namur']|nr:DNA polymerase III subunit gamma/tau [Holosporaceae bacterium 'Namur']
MQDIFFSDEELIPKEYLALARKYRPKTFDDMIGQPVLVQTLTNAISSKRIPHAIILTGIRGVGKTTSARIIARALNCIGKDGRGSETSQPCGVCDSCVAISGDRHQDVIEIDAASNTGVNDIREIIENAKYRPLSARYKIYIIDEVHMLSNSAFNALLKTLEEPPAHVKFVFATTEIRKIPITILSRCQRFDLKRIDIAELTQHYENILAKEGFKGDKAALSLIANAAQGSVRDGLSMLDQALSLSGGAVDEQSVRRMLGLADLNLVFKLFDNLISGNTLEIINNLKELYDIGADPSLVIQDLLEITHGVTKAKVADLKNIFNFPEFEWNKYSYYADKLSIPFLSRCWQTLLKGLEEMKSSLFPFSNLEMILIRIAYMRQLPTPEELIRSGTTITTMEDTDNPNEVAQKTAVTSFEDMTRLCLERKEMLIYHHLISDLRIAEFSPPNIKVKLLEHAPKSFPLTLQNFLNEHTGQKWSVNITDGECSNPTINEIGQEKERNLKEKIVNSDLVQDILNTFTETEILDIKTTKSF